MAKKPNRGVEEIEKYEYLMVEYIKQISNEILYLLLILTALSLYMLLGVSSQFASQDYDILRIVFLVLAAGGFALFVVSSTMKRKIEAKFEKILS